jgi:hypothetical protein
MQAALVRSGMRELISDGATSRGGGVYSTDFSYMEIAKHGLQALSLVTQFTNIQDEGDSSPVSLR